LAAEAAGLQNVLAELLPLKVLGGVVDRALTHDKSLG
jgi:hypothetical protein